MICQPIKNQQGHLFVTADNGVTFLVRIVTKGMSYGSGMCLTYEDKEPVVEFFDTRFPFEESLQAQFTGGRYFVSTLLDRSGCGALDLQGGVSDWSLDSESVDAVRDWVETQMGVFA